MTRNEKSIDLLDREVRERFLWWKEVPHDLEQLGSNGIAKDEPSTKIKRRENSRHKAIREEHDEHEIKTRIDTKRWDPR